MSSRPIDRRIMSGSTPAAFCSCGAQLLVRGRSRMDHQAARVADVRQVREQLAALSTNLLPGLEPAFDRRSENTAPAPFGIYFFASVVIRAVGQAGILHPRDVLVAR